MLRNYQDWCFGSTLAKLQALPKFEALFAPITSLNFFLRIDASHLKLWQS